MTRKKKLPKLPPEFYDKFDPEYRKKHLQLEENLKASDNIHTHASARKCQNLLADAVNQYMIPKELWDKIFASALRRRFSFKKAMKNSVKIAIYQFYYKQYNAKFPERMLYNPMQKDFSIKGRPIMEEDLCFPHKNLDIKLEEYETYCTDTMIPRFVLRRHEEMKVLYSKIKAVEEDDEKWIKALMETDDIKFVEHNVEYRLGRDFTNKKLWKMYLEYLKSHDYQRLLQTYSKYCRFFLDDTVMMEEYRRAAGNEKVAVPWKNVFDFEIFDETFFDSQQQKCCKKIAEKQPLQCHFTDKNALRQIFPFKENLMHYIITNASAFVLQKLHKSCKWFYLKNPVSICYKFDSHPDEEKNIHIKEQSLFIPGTYSSIPANFGKLFITTHLIFCVSSNFISRIYRCTAKYITISNQKFTDKELEFLIGHANVIDLDLSDVRNLENEYFMLENILKLVPKIKYLQLHETIQCSTNTSQQLYELQFQNKINRFHLSDISNALLEPIAFAEFILKNFDQDAQIFISFNENFEEEFINNYEKIVDDYIIEKLGNYFPFMITIT